MIESVDRAIDGLTFTVTKHPAMKALRLLHKISKIAGPALAKAISAVKGDSLGDIDLSALEPAISTLFQNLPEEDFVSLVSALLEHTFCNGKEISKHFDILFSGKLTTVFKVCAFAFEVNFGSFLDALGALKGLLPKAPETSQKA